MQYDDYTHIYVGHQDPRAGRDATAEITATIRGRIRAELAARGVDSKIVIWVTVNEQANNVVVDSDILGDDTVGQMMKIIWP